MNDTSTGRNDEQPRNRWTTRRLGTAGAATALSAGLLVGGYGIASAATTDTPSSTPSPSASADAESGTTNSDEGTATKEDCPERGAGAGEAPSGSATTDGSASDVVLQGGSVSSYDV